MVLVCVILFSQREDTPMAKRNPVAQDLRTPKYAPRVVQSKKIYNRKKAKNDT